MNLLELFPKKHFIMDLKARDQKGAFKEMIEHLVAAEAISDETGKKLERAVNKRESEGSTGIGKGLAIPHAKACKAIDKLVAVFARSSEGVNFNAVDGEPVNLVFLVCSPLEQADQHLIIMRKIAAMHKDEKTLKFLRTTDKVENIFAILEEIDEDFVA